MFDFEWTGRRHGDESDHVRGVTAAREYCERHGIDPATAYRGHLDAIERGEDPPGGPLSWYRVAWEAEQAYCENWHSAPENFGLVWRPC